MENSERRRSRKRPRTKTPTNMSMEMIFRRSLMDSLREYVQCCSLVGLKEICDPTLGWFLRTIWALVFCTAIGTVCYFLKYTWSDTLAKPLIVTMESSTYPIGSIEFPAVAICNNNRISKKALVKFALEEYPDLATNESLKDVERMLLNWGRLINFSFNETLRTNPMFNRMVEKYRHNNDRIEQIMKMMPKILSKYGTENLKLCLELAPSCEEMLLKCAWGGTIVDCLSIFTTTYVANRGHCCTFNYWKTKHALETKKQREAGRSYGLNVILNPMIEDYAYQIYGMLGFEVLIFNPAHFADPNAGRVIQRFSEPNMAVYLELKSTKQVATTEVRKYSIENRKCLFHDEDVETQLFDVYSYSTCIVVCRINTIYSLCKCTPFFFAVKDYQRGPVCTLESLRCLNKYREKFYYLFPINSKNTVGLELEVEDSLYCPFCLPDCELIQYRTKSFEIPLTSPYESKDYQSTFRANINMTNKSFLSVYHPLPDANLDRLDIVLYWYEILSNIGGFSGVCMGFSLISGVEIIYFLTVRLVTHFYINYKKYR